MISARRSFTALSLGLVCITCLLPWAAFADGRAAYVRVPSVALSGQPFELEVEGCAGCSYTLRAETGEPLASGRLASASPASIEAQVDEAGTHRLQLELQGVARPISLRVLGGWLSVVPPLAAIALAIALRNVFVALLAGVWLGAWAATGAGPLLSLWRVLDTYLWNTLLDEGNQSILAFSLMLGGLIGLVSESGGGAGLATQLARFATNRARAQISIWVFGVLMFFDDYVSTLLVGSSMRPLADRLRISREKLAFLADATSAPIASLAIASSWIGVELGYIADQSRSLGLGKDAYSLFLESLPYRFYPWLMLAFGLYLSVRGREYGPMRHAELRTLDPNVAEPEDEDEKPSLPTPARESHWAYAALPVGVTVVVIMGMLLYTGLAASDFVYESLGQVLSAASGSRALLVGASLGCVTAAIALLAGGIMAAKQVGFAWLKGAGSVLEAMAVLMCAWALGAVCRDLSTASYLIGLLDGSLSGGMVPAVVFVVSALTSFATGSSWGTMGLIFPLAVPLAHNLAGGDPTIIASTVGSILAGSVWGDHCSPISDTTIMSSMAAGCDHVAHVRTQLPYALTVGIVAVLAGDLPTGLGWWGPYVGLLLGALLLVGIVELIGRRVPA